jgi:hypothetical protein
VHTVNVMGRAKRGVVASAVAVVLLGACASTRHDGSAPSRLIRSAVPPVSTSTTTPSRPTTTVAGAVRRPVAEDAYAGLGAWVDVYDALAAFGGPTVRPSDVAAMARAGVRTLYLQVAKDDPRTSGPLADPAVVAAFVRAAHTDGLRVVGWYLPTFDRPVVDADRVRAMAALRVDGRPLDSIALDIEDVSHVTDVAIRNDRLVALARFAARAAGHRIGAIVLPPVATELVNRTVWPAFPWRALAPSVAAWLPMAYSSFRTVASGWHDPARYSSANVVRIRRDVGDTHAEVHVVGGLAATFDAAAAHAFVRGARAAGAQGWSIYDWATTSPMVTAHLSSG